MSPAQSLVFGVLVLVAGIAFTALAARSAHRSSVTQHGTPVVGQVLAADESYHSSRSGGYYTSRYEVREPSGEMVWARARGRADDRLVGRPLQIVVDPADPTYAELPGSPMTSWTGVWIGGLLFVVLTLLTLRGAARRFLPPLRAARSH